MGRPHKISGLTALDIRENKEKPRHHRELLLFAMQDEGVRSTRAAARAVGVSESTVRGHRKKFKWDERIESMGPSAQTTAVRLYREMYHRMFGQGETAVVECNMSIPVRPMDPMPEPGKPGSGQRLAAAQALDEPKTRRLQTRYSRVFEQSANRFARKLLDEDDKTEIRNVTEFLEVIKRNLELQAGLDGLNMPGDTQDAVIETVRVRQARARGGDLVAAMADDCEELTAIFGALTARRTAAQEAMKETLNE